MLLAVVCLLSAITRAQSLRDAGAVRNLITAYTEAWDQADAATLAGFYEQSGDLVIPTGQVFSGPHAIGSFYAQAFEHGYKGSRGEGTIVRLRFVTPEVVLLDGVWSITGAHFDGKESVPERGVFTALVVKSNERWLIRALREQTSATSLQVNSP